MERLDQRARALVVARLDPLDHLADEFGLQPVVLVEPGLGRRGAGARAGASSSLSLISLLLSDCAGTGGFLGAPAGLSILDAVRWRIGTRRA